MKIIILDPNPTIFRSRTKIVDGRKIVESPMTFIINQYLEDDTLEITGALGSGIHIRILLTESNLFKITGFVDNNESYEFAELLLNTSDKTVNCIRLFDHAKSLTEYI